MSKVFSKQIIGDSNISYSDAALISVPNTSIVNRAPIRDLANDMGTRMGIERIPTQVIYPLQNEFGATGEPVFAVVNDDRNLIRFVGTWLSGINTSGQIPNTTINGDYVEITFYGTGLNLLVQPRTVTTPLSITVDGVASTAINSGSLSNGLDGRNYASNTVLVVTSGLNLGIHTVKIAANFTTGTTNLGVHGFEILNTASTIRINAGSLIKDQMRFTLNAAQTLAYKPSTLTSTRGGRVVVYNQGGTIGQAVQAVDASPLNLTSANHANEEVVRTYHWREFGASRTANDDFTTPMTGSDRAFTLDDGTTTLIVKNGFWNTSYDGFYLTSATNYVIFTFVGTGLDLMVRSNTTSTGVITIDSHDVAVDGTSIGSVTSLYNSGTTGTNGSLMKIVSGLPYGTHTVRITRTVNVGQTFMFVAAKVYQPKKPTLPVGATELADYNVLTDFVRNTSNAGAVTGAIGLDSISAGTLRKQVNVREATFSGSWGTPGMNMGVSIGGFQNGGGNTAPSYIEYTFFGTGFDCRGPIDTTRAPAATVTLNGLAASTANFPTLLSGVNGMTSYNAATGTLNMAGASIIYGAGFQVYNLPLAKYTVRITSNTAAGNPIYIDTFDVITPIHSHKSNLSYDQQNTLPIGSMSLSDSRQLTTQNAPKRNISQAVGVTTDPTTASGTFVPMPDMSVTHFNSSGKIKISYSIVTANTGTNTNNNFRIYIDGIAVGANKQYHEPTGNMRVNSSDCTVANVSSGYHKVDIYWLTNSGTLTASNTDRNLLVEEI